VDIFLNIKNNPRSMTNDINSLLDTERAYGLSIQ
jgi:hypothetical protein